MKRKSCKKPVGFLLAGLALGFASTIPFLLTLNQTVASGDYVYGVGINNWGTRQDNTKPLKPGDPSHPFVDVSQDMHLKNGTGFFGKKKYPTDYFKFYEYVNQCSKFNNDKAILNKETAILVKDKFS